MVRTLLALGVVLLCAGAAMAQQEAMEASGTGPADNIFLEAGGGVMLPEGEDSTGLAYGGANYGLAIWDEYSLGLQAGGKVTLRDNDQDYLVSAGLFQRDIPIGKEMAAWSVQGVYQNTWDNADLMSARPVLGMSVGPDNYMALVGVWGLNDERVSRVPRVTQEVVDQAMLLWGAEGLIAEDLTTELAAGYAFGEVDAANVGAHVGFQLDELTSLNVTGQVDFEGNYFVGGSMAFDLARKGRNPSLNNIGTGDTKYAPFPLGSLPVNMYQSYEQKVSSGFIPIPE